MRPNCYGCDRPAAIGHLFCSARCAAAYGEELVRGNCDEWCPTCGQWSGHDYKDEHGVNRLVCGHPHSDITEGMSHKDAAARYRDAIAERPTG
jgi:hypothetical protein